MPDPKADQNKPITVRQPEKHQDNLKNNEESDMMFRISAAALLSALLIFPVGCSLFRAKNKPAAPQTTNVFSLPRGTQPHKTAKTETVEEFLNRPRVQ